MNDLERAGKVGAVLPAVAPGAQSGDPVDREELLRVLVREGEDGAEDVYGRLNSFAELLM